jgi:hypothetical protein
MMTIGVMNHFAFVSQYESHSPMSDLETFKQLIHITLPLLTVCNQSYSGYQQASTLIHDRAVKVVLLRYASQRLDYCQQIVDRVYRPRGIDIDKQDLRYGLLHDKWRFPQDNVSGDAYIIAVCRQADFAAIRIYDQILENPDFPEDLHAIVQAQRSGIYRTWEHLRELQKLY